MKPPPTKPIPFNPSAVAPMGSLGDDFDGRIPTESERPAAPKPAPRPKPLPRQPAARRPEVLVGSSIPSVLVLGAIFWQTPGQQIRSSVAFAAILLALVMLTLLHTRFRGLRGAWRNYAAIALGVIFLAIPEREFFDRPLRVFHASVLNPIINPPRKTPGRAPVSGLQSRREAWSREIDLVRFHMRKAAEISARIAVECEPDKVVIVGDQARVSASPQWKFYAFVPVLNLDDECAKANLDRWVGRGILAGDDPISGVPEPLRDRFSPEGRWLYGTVIKGEQVLTWSPGPDGRMDFSPLKEFRSDDPNVLQTMILKSYDPTNGMMSSGDLMELTPLPKPEEIGF